MARIGELIGPNGEVMHPKTSASVVYLEDGRSVEQVLSDDIDYGNAVFQDNSYKFDSDVEDDFAKTVIIKGQTYQNILPEPSTHVLTNNKEMFKVNEGLDPNVEIVDGVSKSAILSGQTLVNLCNASNRSETLTSSSRIFYCKIPYTIKANSVYTFFAKISNSTTSGQINLQYAHPDGTYSYPKIMDASTNGVVNTNIVNAKDITNILIYISNMDTGQVTVSDVMIIEGDYTNVNVPYFKGMQSVQMPVLKSVGKNLFDENNVTVNANFVEVDNIKNAMKSSNINFYISKDEYWSGTFSYNNGILTMSPISPYKGAWIMIGNLKPNSKATISYTFNGEGSIGGASNSTATVDNDGYCKFVIENREAVEYSISKIQIEYGESSSAYEPHKSNILSCQLAPLNQSMFEQGTFSESTTPNTQPYEGIKLNSGGFYNNRIRTKGTYKVVQGATYEGQLNDGYGIFICYCKNGLYSTTVNRWFDETRFTFTVPNDCDEMFFALRKTDNSAITPSDYPLIGLKIHQEVVLRSLPNGVKDTLNLNTGEYVQRIGEIVLDGSENYWYFREINENTIRVTNDNLFNSSTRFGINDKLYQCNQEYQGSNDVECLCIRNDKTGVGVRVSKQKLSSLDSNGFRQWLSQNPITVQYELATPIIKTVDVSSSGNWEKVVLDGSENWVRHGNYGSVTRFNVTISNMAIGLYHVFSDKFSRGAIATNDLECVNNHYSANQFQLQIKTSRLTSDSVDGLKQYLSQNPLTVWYQTKTHLDSTQVKQPIFFKDGHIIQSSGADHSLIPTLDYQAKTSNSYVMDLMKTNTKYTMKAKSASGTFTIDGTSYGAGTNGTFTTPSSMTNKLLVMSNKTNTEVMIIEGDVTGKQLPYYKGIRSAYDDVNKVEVLSQNKNLFDMSKVEPYEETGIIWWDTIIKENEVVSVRSGNIGSGQFGAYATLNVRPNSVYTLYIEMEKDGEPFNGQIYVYENDKVWGTAKYAIYANTPYRINTSQNAKYITIGFNYGRDFPIGTTLVSKNMRLYLGEESPVYIPHANNTTIINMPTRWETVKVVKPVSEDGGLNQEDGSEIVSVDNNYKRFDYIPVQPNDWILIYNNSDYRAMNCCLYDINKNFIKHVYTDGRGITIPKNCYFIRGYSSKANTSNLNVKIQRENPTALNKLPNGVKDELIINRATSSAKLIRRVGKVVLDGSEDISIDNAVMTSDYTLNKTSTYFRVNPTSFTLQKPPSSYSGQPNMLCDSLVVTSRQESQQTISNSICLYNDGFGMRQNNNINNSLSLQTHLKQNPITVYYELATPVITEVDLEGFPYIYKDGHIFLNGEITPTVGIEYSLNQGHRIAGQVETLQRHEKQFSKLEQYFADLVYSDYNFALLRFSEKLRQQEGDV